MIGWKRFEDPEFGLSFSYPDPSPRGFSVDRQRISSSQMTRVHLSTPESGEIYFELARGAAGLDPAAGRNNLIDENRERFQGFQASPLSKVQIAGLPAHSFVFTWTEASRQVFFFELEPHTHRIILDPESDLNHQILSTIELMR